MCLLDAHVPIGAVSVRKLTADALGIAGGSQPMLVIIPAWIRKDVVQASFVPGAVNTISATLQANFELRVGSVVVFGGLSAGVTERNQLGVTTIPPHAIKGNAGSLSKDDGELRLTVDCVYGGWMSGVVSVWMSVSDLLLYQAVRITGWGPRHINSVLGAGGLVKGTGRDYLG